IPQLLRALRCRVAEELYDAGERLLRCVEADFRERHSRPYHPLPITGAERALFRSCLADAGGEGSLQSYIVALLRTQESFRAIVAKDLCCFETGHNGGDQKRTVVVCGIGSSSGVDKTGVETRRLGRAGGSVGIECDSVKDTDLASLRIGPGSSPGEKARAARVLRNRLMTLLEEVEDVWTERRHARPGRTNMKKKGSLPLTLSKEGLSCSTHRHRREQGQMVKRRREGLQVQTVTVASQRVSHLDTGAGPRAFWEAVAGTRFVDAPWNVNLE
ncbi:unnamed protein product, partial [Choristocarpus tenellus]